MKKIIYLSIVLLVVSLFLISIGFSSPTLFNNNENNNNKFIQQDQNHLDFNNKNNNNNFNNIIKKRNNNNKVDKSINEIIKKGYQRLVDGLKLKSQYHFEEEKYAKRALEKQQTNPLGYKCQHDNIIDKRYSKIKNQLKSEKSINNLKKSNNLVSEAVATTPSKPIRFTFNTSFITGTTDPYACHKVGDIISVGDVTANQDCKPDGSVSPCIYTCTEKDVQTTELQNFYKNNIIETIKDVFESRLLVRNPVDNYKFNENSNEGVCDYGVTIPESYFTEGVRDTDIYVWVTSRPTSSNNTIAYAFACNFDIIGNQFSRPTAASINFNPSFFVPFIGAENSISFNEYVRVGIHEMTHALGFSSSFFDSYVEPNTDIVIRDGVGAAETFTFSGTTPNGKKYKVDKAGIYSDNVVAFAKKHYNCDNIEYQELEDFGGQGTAGSHWESRTAGEEYMLGYVSPIMPITDLSFSLLIDSGWYEINQNSTREPLIWGLKLGCEFVQKECSASTWNYQGYFCTEPGATSCTGTRMGKGVCRIVQGSKDWPPLYQHFDDPKLTGYNLAADGCPFYQVQDNNVYCFDTSKQSIANNQVYETYCENCRCFEYQDGSNIQQACWEQQCGPNGLQIKINNNWIDCPDSQTVVSNNVTVVCPTGYTVCGGAPKPVEIAVGANSSSIIFPTFILLISSLIISLYLYI